MGNARRLGAVGSTPYGKEGVSPFVDPVRPAVDNFRRFVVAAATLAFAVRAGGQPVPLGDVVEKALLPGGITSLDVNLNATLAYLFRDEDGTDVVHLIGDFLMTLEEDGPVLRAREAVVWIHNRTLDDRPYRHLAIMLWRDAEIMEPAGTTTAGPALFVTLNTFGRVRTEADDVAFEPTTETRVYQEGNTIRKTVETIVSPKEDARVFQRLVDLSSVSAPGRRLTPPPLLHLRAGGELVLAPLPDGREAMTATGGVFLGRGSADSDRFLQITADSVVVFFPPASEKPGGQEKPEPAGMGKPERSKRDDSRRSSGAQTLKPPQQRMTTGMGEYTVEAAYLEGDVVMRQGPHEVRASRLYYDFNAERALILDAVFHTPIPSRNVPLYVRAEEIRQLSARHFVAEDARITTDEFHTPHYHLGVGRVELMTRTARTPAGDIIGLRSGTLSLRNVTLNVGGRPILYWPVLKGSLDTSETALLSFRTGFSDDFGAEFETRWKLFNLLGYVEPEGFDSDLRLEYFSKRGPAAGVNVTYEQARYFGLLRGYLLRDRGRDNLGRDRVAESKHDIRGRILLRHRQYLEDDWEVTLELSYISDRNFLEEFFESEFDNDKEQETLLYLKRRRDDRTLTLLWQTRLLDFTTQTERFPDIAYRVIGEALPGGSTWFSENRLGFVRFRPADPTFDTILLGQRSRSSGMTARVDTRQEVTHPLDLGPVRVVPFAAGRLTAWDDSPRRGGLVRGMATYGVRAGMYLSKTIPDVHSPVLDLHGLRHIIKPELVLWASHANRNPDDLFPFDEGVERVDKFDGALVGVRQRWQTKRGPPDRRRIVDVLTLDVEAGFFNGSTDAPITNGFVSFSRPETSLARNFFNGSLAWRVNDRTALVSEWNYDVNDGEMDIFNVALAVERPPRLSYLVGYRFIEESDSELFGFDLNYRMTEKHTLAVRELFDLDRGRTLDFTVALIRRFPRWFGAISFALDEP
ncbi:MAG: LPS-assembly protein LptD, partial [Planctomycetota bacterium]